VRKRGVKGVESAEQVKRANREFYDTVGGLYEALDGRRSLSLSDYVDARLSRIRRECTGETLLDLGSGSGFVTRMAERHFLSRYALDLSHRVLGSLNDPGVCRIVGDSDALPLREESVDCVVTFAVLHHCYAYDRMMAEILRVLKKGGVYYSDHDMDGEFHERYRPLLGLYRLARGAARRYGRRFQNLSRELYARSEIHEDGIPSGEIASSLWRLGFREVTLEFHWYGLSSWSDRMFGKKTYRRGYAPLTRITAIK